MPALLRRRGVEAKRRIAQIQKKVGDVALAATSQGRTFDQATVAGNTLIAVITSQSANSLAQITSPSGFSTHTEFRRGTAEAIRIAYKVSDGTETTLTASFTNSANVGLQVFEYQGLHSSPVDQGTSATIPTTDTTVTAGPTGTTTVPTELVIAGLVLNGAITNMAVSDGFTLETATNTRPSVASKILGATGTPQTTFTWTTSRVGAGAIATFKAA